MRSSASRTARSDWVRSAVICARRPVSSPSAFSLSASAASAACRRSRRLGLALGHRGVGGLEAVLLLVEAGEDGAVVRDHPLLAGDVVAELGQPPVEFGEPFADARFLGVERLAGMVEALQRRAGARGGIAEVGEGGGGRRLLLRRRWAWAAARCVGERGRLRRARPRPRASASVAASQRRWRTVASAWRISPERLR